MSNLKKLLQTLPQIGRLEWIGLRPAKKKELQPVTMATISKSFGLEGDHFKSSRKKRSITIIQREHLDFVAQMMGVDKEEIPFLTRRNMVVSGINLLAFKDKQFQVGADVILEYTDPCHPCSRMEENLGAGGLNAMRGHGGICCKVIQGGEVNVGDEVRLIS